MCVLTSPPGCAVQTSETVHNQFEQTLWRKRHRGRVRVRDRYQRLDIEIQVRPKPCSA